jgi:hypothetical protein
MAIVISALQQRQDDCEDEKCAGGIFRDFGQHRAGTRPEERVCAARAECQNSPRFFFRELDEDKEYQDDAVQHHRQGE